MEELVRRAHEVHVGFQDLKHRYDAFIASSDLVPPVLIVHDQHLELAALVEELTIQVKELTRRVDALEQG